MEKRWKILAADKSEVAALYESLQNPIYPLQNFCTTGNKNI